MIHSRKIRSCLQVQAVLLLSVLLVLSGCMTERVQPLTEYPSVPKQTTFMAQKVEYDEYGRPVFREKLNRRPGSAGEQFTLVQTVNERPVRSYDIAIIEQQQADMRKPLAIIYEWTGRGFQGGLDISGNYSGHFVSGSSEAAVVYLAVLTAPIVIGGVTGFVVGIISSIPETATELRHVIVNAREMVTGYTLYEYDEKGRIRLMKIYPPEEHAEELVKTEFHYNGDGDVPSKTEVTSLVEKKMRMVH